MKVLCSSTCGYCKAKNELVATTSRIVTTTSTQTVHSKEQCRDLRKDCAKLASTGYCKKTQEAMERLCPASCGICGVQPTTTPPTNVCKDRMKGCHIMLGRGFCVRNKEQMLTRCQKTCNLCPSCADQRDDCDKYHTFGWCERKQKDMAISCPKTCNLCHMVKPTPKAQKVCIDQRSTVQCQKMARLGFCQSRPGMKTVCTKTCGLCGGGGETKNQIPTVPPSRQRVTGSHCKDRYGRARCEYYSQIGWCEKYERIKENCVDTCVCNYKKPKAKPVSKNCNQSQYGCCWDNKTIKTDHAGSSCPACEDDRRFVILCQRFGGDCDGNAALAKSLRKHCSKTCRLC